ncbi:MAG: restriction endonuclease [Nitrospirae bacterium]|nr:restriction endonuclease [Nitrospirota bacterium]
MNITFDIPWKRYVLIAELAKRLDTVSPQFGKTALQKLVFLLQEVYKIDCGYDFELYSYGPFDSQLLGDLDLVESWGCVSVESVNALLGGYRIHPTKKVDLVREKATGFLDDAKTKSALDNLVSTYGALKARDLELRATTVYVERNLWAKNESPDKTTVCRFVAQIKPRFTRREIDQVVDELSERGHIRLSAENNMATQPV